MTMYATKVWGFASADWPVITFSKEGVRNRLASLWKPGDTMLLIGTQQEPTDLSCRGKILGYLEFTAVPVLTRNIVAPAVLAIHGDKWPYALLCTESWELNAPPLFKEFFPDLAARYPGMSLASNFAALSPEEEQRVRSLRAVHRVLPKNEAAQLAADKTAAIQQIHGGGRGPIAFTGSYTVTKTSSPAQTYLMKLKEHDLMKIGWAYNPDARAKKLSESLVPSFTDMRWEVVQFHRWPNEYAARFMEQVMLDRIIQSGIATSSEYFRKPNRIETITSEMWYEAIISTERHTGKLPDEELIPLVDAILSDVADDEAD